MERIKNDLDKRYDCLQEQLVDKQLFLKIKTSTIEMLTYYQCMGKGIPTSVILALKYGPYAAKRKLCGFISDSIHIPSIVIKGLALNNGLVYELPVGFSPPEGFDLNPLQLKLTDKQLALLDDDETDCTPLEDNPCLCEKGFKSSNNSNFPTVEWWPHVIY